MWAERRIRTYRAVNTLRLSYKNQSVNAVQRNNRCMFSDPHKTHKHTVWAEFNFHVKEGGVCCYRCALMVKLTGCIGPNGKLYSNIWLQQTRNRLTAECSRCAGDQ